MSHKSDIGFCCTHNVWKNLKQTTKDYIQENLWLVYNDNDGLVFKGVGLIWQEHADLRIRAIYDDLFFGTLAEAYTANEFYLIKAHYSYPEDNLYKGDRGQWFDNPWGLRRETTVTVVVE